MATCGPSNPGQNLKSFVERDGSLHTEKYQPVGPSVRGIRSNGAPSAQRQQQQFDQFAHTNPSQFFNGPNYPFDGPELFGPQFNGRSAVPTMPARQVSPSVGYANPARAQIAEADWAAEFQQLSLQDQRQRGQSHQSHFQSISRPEFQPHAQFQPQFVPQFAHQPFQPQYQPQHQHFPHQVSKPIASEEAFDAAFEEAELSFKRTHQRTRAFERQLTPEVEQTSEHERQGEDASDIANKIINTLHEKTPGQDDLSTKLQNSKFMNLMTKLSTNEIMLGEKDLLNASDNAKVEPFDLHQDVRPRPEEHIAHPQSSSNEIDNLETSHSGANDNQRTIIDDWAPQRPITQPLEQGSANKLPSLDDPETYLFKMKQNLDPRVFKKSEYTSSFLSAKEHALPSLEQQSWEENYDEW